VRSLESLAAPAWSRELAETATARALRRLLRGGSWPGLAREIAWQAIRAGGCESARLEALAALVEEQLGLRVDGLEVAVERAAVTAAGTYLARWPNDPDGAKAYADVEAADEAIRLLAHGYADVLGWATEVAAARSERAGGRHSTGCDPTAPRALATTVLPALIADDLARPRERFGWSLAASH
jgi:hypothetical protein